MESGHLTGPEGSDERLKRLGNLGASLASLVSTQEGTLGWTMKLRSAWREIVKMWEENQEAYGKQPEPAPSAKPQRVTCGECRFWESPNNTCHRHVPSNADGEWPCTLADEWCGEGEPKA